MPLFGSKKKTKICRFCGKTAQYVKEYDEFFCPHCQRFQIEEQKTTETKLLQIFKLKKYLFVAQKSFYTIFNELGSKIARCERRDISRYATSTDQHFRYYFFNDVNRIIATVNSSTVKSLKEQDALWKVCDYGLNLRGEIRNLAGSDTWQILDPRGQIIALRDPADGKTPYQAKRFFTILDAEDPEAILFKVARKGGFKLTIISEEVDPHLAWAFIIGIHRKYFI